MNWITKTVLLCFVIALSSSCEKEDSTSGTDNRDPYVAVWVCEENSAENGTSTFEVHINKSSSNSSLIVIENLYNYGFSFLVIAEVNTTGDEFTISSQIVNGNTISGSGKLIGTETINMNYNVDNGAGVDIVTATLTKKH